MGVETGVDLPLVGSADLGESRAARRGAEAAEQQDIPRGCAVAGEVSDGVAARFTRVEDEGVVAGVAGQRVRPLRR